MNIKYQDALAQNHIFMIRIKTKIGEKGVQLKKECTLLSRFLKTARKRPKLDLEDSLENYEFAVVLKSIFTLDGQPLHSFDKGCSCNIVNGKGWRNKY